MTVATNQRYCLQIWVITEAFAEAFAEAAADIATEIASGTELEVRVKIRQLEVRVKIRQLEARVEIRQPKARVEIRQLEELKVFNSLRLSIVVAIEVLIDFATSGLGCCL